MRREQGLSSHNSTGPKTGAANPAESFRLTVGLMPLPYQKTAPFGADSARVIRTMSPSALHPLITHGTPSFSTRNPRMPDAELSFPLTSVYLTRMVVRVSSANPISAGRGPNGI